MIDPKKSFILLLFATCSIGNNIVLAQENDAEYDSLLNYYLTMDSLWLNDLENDSSSFLSLLDSLLLYTPKSLISAGINYNSQVFSSGRTYGIKQYGVNYTAGFYHKSGAYLTGSGQYYSGLEPNFNSYGLSVGYSGFLSNKWGYVVNYGHTFFNEIEGEQTLNSVLNNSIGLSSYYYFKWLTLGIDYYYLFGSDNLDGHKLSPNISFNIKPSEKGILKHFRLQPTIYANWGTATLYTSQYSYQRTRELIQKIGLRKFLIGYRRQNQYILDYISEESSNNTFGLLNMLFIVPLQFQYKGINASISYNYNLPFALPDEDLQEQGAGYVGLSLSYSLSF